MCEKLSTKKVFTALGSTSPTTTLRSRHPRHRQASEVQPESKPESLHSCVLSRGLVEQA